LQQRKIASLSEWLTISAVRDGDGIITFVAVFADIRSLAAMLQPAPRSSTTTLSPACHRTLFEAHSHRHRELRPTWAQCVVWCFKHINLSRSVTNKRHRPPENAPA
jgi:hypothetical protein